MQFYLTKLQLTETMETNVRLSDTHGVLCVCVCAEHYNDGNAKIRAHTNDVQLGEMRGPS